MWRTWVFRFSPHAFMNSNKEAHDGKALINDAHPEKHGQ